MKQMFLKQSETIRRWMIGRYWPIVLVGGGLLLTLPALGIGWIVDDYFHRDMLTGNHFWPPAQDASLFGLYSFFDGTLERMHALIETGVAPWWISEHIRVAFWRPVTELTLWLDYQLWPNTPWLMHAHSLLWFGAIIWVVAKLYRRIIGQIWVAGLAGLLFAFDNAHALPAGFLAQRNTLVAVFFGSLALLVHVRWRQDDWRAGAVWGPLCYLVGLLSKESALAIGAYLFAYTIFLDRTRVHRRIIGFLPYAALTVGWYLTYCALGFGVQGEVGIYIDPGRETLLFIQALPVRIAMLLVGQFSGPPSELWALAYTVIPYANIVVGSLVIAITALIGLILWPLLRRDAAVRFWGVGMVLGLIPVCATIPSNRMLFFAGIGAMGIIARFLASWVEQPAWLPAHRLWKRAGRLLCTLFVSVHLILSPLTLPLYLGVLGGVHALFYQVAARAPYADEMSGKTVVLVNPPVEALGAFLALIRVAHGYPVPARVWSLASGKRPLTVTRIDAHTIEIACAQGLVRGVPLGFLRRPSHPMKAGQRIVLSGMTIDVLALADHWQPSRVRFTFAAPLDDPSLMLLYWEEYHLRPSLYTLPAIGESEQLPPIFSIDGFVPRTALSGQGCPGYRFTRQLSLERTVVTIE